MWILLFQGCSRTSGRLCDVESVILLVNKFYSRSFIVSFVESVKIKKMQDLVLGASTQK